MSKKHKGGKVKSETQKPAASHAGKVAELHPKGQNEPKVAAERKADVPTANADSAKAASTPAPAAGGSVPAVAQTPRAAPPRPLKIHVLKKDAKLRGAREKWYERLKEYDGKTEGEFIQSAKETPPALTGNGTAENPAGWIGWFKRQGIVELKAP